MKYLTNHNKNNYKYLLNWMGNIIQNPVRKNGVCIVIKSDQGTGKSSFFKWFGNKIIGKQWFLSINDARILVENKFNSELQNKLFTLLDEAQTNGRYIVGNERMKTNISEDWIRIEMKGCESYIIEDRNNYVLLTNNDFPVKIDYTDRRYCCFNASNELIKNKDYFKNYFEILENDDVAKEFYYYLLNLNLKDFYCEDIPETELKTQIRIDSSPTPIKYAIDLLQNGYTQHGEPNINEILSDITEDDKNQYVDSQKLYMNYKQFVLNKCSGDKLYQYSGFNKKLKELLNIKSEKSKNLGEITFINKNTLKNGLCEYFNVENINEIFNTNLTYNGDEGYNTDNN